MALAKEQASLKIGRALTLLLEPDTALERGWIETFENNLNRLRKEGRILLGGRYSDRGFLVVSGSSVDEVRGLFDADPAVVHQTFLFEAWEFRPFYPGCVGAKAP